MPENRCLGPTCLYPAAVHAARGSVRRTANLASIAGVIVCLTAVSLQAQTLPDALAETYNTTPQLLAQRALLRATDEQVPQALSFWRPTVNFTGQAGISANSIQSAPTVGVTDRRHVQLRPNLLEFQAIQPIYRGGRTEAQTRQAINTVE